MKNRDKIVFLAPGFPEDERDSNCIPALQSYIRTFSRVHPEVAIAVIAFQYPTGYGKYRWHDIQIYACGGQGRGKLQRLRTWMRAFRYFLQIHKEQPVTLIHSFWLDECTFMGQWIARSFNLKHVTTIMGQDVLPQNRYLNYLDFSRITVTCGSKKSAQLFQEQTGYTVHNIIARGLDAEEANFASDRASVTLEYHEDKAVEQIETIRDIDILGVGSLINLKNYGFFIDAVTSLIPFFPALKAVIIGGGEQYDLLKQRVGQRRLQDHLEFTGELPRRNVFEYMKRSKILLHPSSYEAQAYVFMEAIYSGMHVVCFDVGHAECPDRIHICSNENEVIETLKQRLARPLNHESYLIKSMEDTVHEYVRLYHYNARS